MSSAVIKALAKARPSFQVIHKDSYNPFTKGRYASLDAVLNAVTTALTENGLQIVQTIQDRTLITRLYHESGEFLESVYPLPETNDAQKLGAAITYGRRYTICPLLSLVADEDDDGESVKPSGRSNSAPPKQNSAPQQEPASRKDFSKNSATSNPHAAAAAQIAKEAVEAGIPAAEIKAACLREGLPASSKEFTNSNQVSLFGELISALATDLFTNEAA